MCTYIKVQKYVNSPFYRAKGNEQDAAWDWLAENNTNNSPSSTSVDASWHLLKELVLALEVKGQSGLKKAVATRLLTLNTPLPAWLVTGNNHVTFIA